MALNPAETVWFWVAFFAYIGMLMIIGVVSSKKTKNIDDFMVANRGIGSVLTGLSYGVTYFSAVLLIGCPGLTWMLGSQWMFITLMNLSLGTIGAFLILGNRTRKMSEKLGALTLPELIAERYQDEKYIRPIAGLVIAVFQTIYLVSIFTGLSILLQVLFPGVENAYKIAVIICGAITATYLIIGGSHSAILSDLIESLIMVTGLLTLIIGGVVMAGGMAALNANIRADVATSGYFGLSADQWLLFPNALSMSMLGMAMVTTFGTWGSPQMATRFFTSKDRRSIRYGMVIAATWVFIVSFCAWFAGYVGRGQPVPGGATASLQQFAQNTAGSDSVPKNWYEYTMPWMIVSDYAVLPVGFAALFLAAVTAASLTTGEKLILVASSSVARDFYQKGIMKDKDISDEQTLKVTRYSIIAIVVITVLMALWPPAMILDLCMFSWASLNAFTLVPFVAGLYWKKGTKRAALISGIVALTVAVLWFVLFNQKWRTPGLPLLGDWGKTTEMFSTPWFTVHPSDIHEFLVSQGVAIPLFFIISALDKDKPDKEFLDDLFDYISSDKEIDRDRSGTYANVKIGGLGKSHEAKASESSTPPE
ncbi:MAG: sodium:solute symporter family transporter [Promethearchaeota archaeon]